MRRHFFRSLPRPIRRLAYAMGFVTVGELVLLVLGLRAGGDWSWLAFQLWSLSIGPLIVGILVVVAVGIVASRRSQTRQDKHEVQTRSEVPYEIAAARTAAQLLGSAARHPQGRQAVRRASRLAAALRAAAQADDEPKGSGPK